MSRCGWVPTWVRHRREQRDARARAELENRNTIMARARREHAEKQAAESASSSEALRRQLELNGWTELLLHAWKGREA